MEILQQQPLHPEEENVKTYFPRPPRTALDLYEVGHHCWMTITDHHRRRINDWIYPTFIIHSIIILLYVYIGWGTYTQSIFWLPCIGRDIRRRLTRTWNHWGMYVGMYVCMMMMRMIMMMMDILKKTDLRYGRVRQDTIDATTLDSGMYVCK